MSYSSKPSDSSTPGVKDKDPHNYRKVGYSMIVISVSLVVIGLLVWAIGDNYHFSSDIMANQEIEAMTPKHGYTIVYYDTAQPVGAKMKLLDSASALYDAQQKQVKYAKQNPNINGMVIIFNETYSSNQKLVQDTIGAIGEAQTAKAESDKLQAEKALAAQASNTTSANKTNSVIISSVGNVGSNGTTSVHMSNLTNANNTGSHNKTVSLSDSVGIQVK